MDRLNRLRSQQENGSAMIITLMVMMLVGALATTVSVVTINNLQSSWRAQQAGSAVNAADAGIAQAMSYLRANGVRELNKCSPTCSGNPWGNKANSANVSVPGAGGQSYRVWIEVVAAYPTNDTGRYFIHSKGIAPGQAVRQVQAEVQVTGSSVGKGIFAREIAGGGSASVTRQSVFSTGCVYRRGQISMDPAGIDAIFGIPIAVHSAQIITDSNESGQYCPGTKKPIHEKPGKPCDAGSPFDQDSRGGHLLSSSACYDSRMATTWAKYFQPRDVDGDGVNDVDGSYINTAGLREVYGLQTPILTSSQIDQLRATAQAQNNYHTESTGWTSPDETQAVMFFDLTATDSGGEVNLNDISGFSREKNQGTGCVSKSLIIVIEGGNAKINSNQQLAASLFLTSDAPNGQFTRGNGTADFIGTIYADTIDLKGNIDLSLDPCFVDNPSPALLDFNVTSYREIDR